MNIYVGKNRLKAKKTTLKALIEKAINIDNDCITVKAGRLSDNSDSYIEFQKETDNLNDLINKNGIRVDVYLSFDPETDFTIRDMEIFILKRITEYDEENVIKI